MSGDRTPLFGDEGILGPLVDRLMPALKRTVQEAVQLEKHADRQRFLRVQEAINNNGTLLTATMQQAANTYSMALVVLRVLFVQKLINYDQLEQLLQEASGIPAQAPEAVHAYVQGEPLEKVHDLSAMALARLEQQLATQRAAEEKQTAPTEPGAEVPAPSETETPASGEESTLVH